MRLLKQINNEKGVIGLFVIVVAIALIAFGAYITKNSWMAQTEKEYRVGILCGLDFIKDIPDHFKAKMTELGYEEGDNITYDIQYTNFDPEEEERILKQFISEKVDLIFTFPTEVSMAAKTATQGTNIPVLFTFANIEGTGLIDSINQPGENITGVRYPGPDLAIKRFEIMMELVPDAKRIWIPYQRGYPIVSSQIDALKPIAEKTGVTLIEFPADDAAELQTELDAQVNSGELAMDVILFVAEPLSVTMDAFEVMASFAKEQNVPIGGALISDGELSTIFGVNVDTEKIAKQAAPIADKILQGTEAGSIPVVSAESFFQVNYTVAQEFGLEVSEGMLSRADEIVR